MDDTIKLSAEVCKILESAGKALSAREIEKKLLKRKVIVTRREWNRAMKHLFNVQAITNVAEPRYLLTAAPTDIINIITPKE